MTITELLEEHGIEYRRAGENEHVSKGWIGLETCPFHSGHPYHLGIHLAGKYASCWTCGALSLFSIFQELGVPWIQVKEAFGDVRADFKKTVESKGKLKFPQGFYPHLLPVHERYLKGRGFDPDELQKVWGLMSIGIAPRLAWRILIPVFHRGATVSWTTRKPSDGGQGLRYINARPDEELLPIKSLLYGGDHVRHAAVIVEGPTDAWRIGPGAVATFGTSWTRAQLRRLAEIPARTIIFDNESSAQRRASKLADLLGVFPGRTRVAQIDAADPGSAKKREVALIRKNFLEN